MNKEDLKLGRKIRCYHSGILLREGTIVNVGDKFLDIVFQYPCETVMFAIDTIINGVKNMSFLLVEENTHCKGKGLNCYVCADKPECDDHEAQKYVTPKGKPPIGIMPKKIWDTERLYNLKEAIKRYCEVNKEIPAEWIEEYNTLAQQVK